MDYDYNAQVTAQVVEMSHACGVSVEGELGCLGSLRPARRGGDGVAPGVTHDQMLTDPDEAKQFVADAGVDALAIACGTSHGAYKFTRRPPGTFLLSIGLRRFTSTFQIRIW